MLILIILLALIITGIIIAITSYDYDIIGFIMTVMFGIYLLLHCLFWSLASYNYNVMLAKRNAFVETLNYARKNNSQIELAAIIKDVSEWNQDLAEEKYDITVFMIKDYTDKRVVNLQPIR